MKFYEISTVNGLLLFLSLFIDRKGKHLSESLKDKWVNFGFELERLTAESIRLKYADFVLNVNSKYGEIHLILYKDNELIKSSCIRPSHSMASLVQVLRNILTEIKSHYELLKKRKSESEVKGKLKLEQKLEDKDMIIAVLKQEVKELRSEIKKLNKKLLKYEFKSE